MDEKKIIGLAATASMMQALSAPLPMPAPQRRRSKYCTPDEIADIRAKKKRRAKAKSARKSRKRNVKK